MIPSRKKHLWTQLPSAAVILVIMLCLTASFAAHRRVQAATTVKYSANFRETSGGRTAAMNKLKKTVNKGESVTLPRLPAKTGYVSVGWSTKKNSTTIQYKPGQKVTLRKNTVFYAVRRRFYIVKFNNNKGNSTSAVYTRLQKKVYKDRYCLLPAIPEAAGYENLGWTTAKGKSTPLYKPGKKVKITANTVFYAVRRKITMCTVVFCDAKGAIDTEYSALSKSVKAGQSIVMPSVKDPDGYTFCGWSHNPSSDAVSYLPGQSVAVSAGMRLYAVMRSNAQEENITEATLQTGWQQSFRKIIFVGDSRTNRLANTLRNEFNGSVKLANVSFISREGEGLDWLKGEGTTQLMELLSTYYSTVPTAVIFNLGVNDLGNLAGYQSYLKELAPQLQQKNCRLFYLSVNPVNNVMIKKTGHANRPEERIIAFNEGIRTGLCGSGSSFTYIDSFTWLLMNGLSYDSGMGDGNVSVITVDDGLHYTGRTYKRIYNYCIESIMKAPK